MLLEKENRELRTEMDKLQDCGSRKQKSAVNPANKYEYLISSQLESALVLDMNAMPPVITDCNTRFTDLFNVKKKDIIGKEILDFIPSKQKEHLLDNLHQIKNYKKHHFELQTIDKHRENQTLDITGYSIIHHEKEVIVLRLRDVTYRSELFAAPLQEEEVMSTLQNYPIYSFYFQFNGEGFNLAKAEDERGELVFREMIRKSAEELLPGHTNLLTDMRQCLREGLRFGRETFFKGFFTDDVIYASIQFAYLQPDYVVMNIYDLTEQKAMQEELQIARKKAEQSEQIKTAFLNNISAELRTPLNAINGFSQLIAMESGNMNKQLLQFCHQIQNNTRQVVNMIDDIMDLARIESGDLKIVYSGIVLNEFLDEIKEKYINMPNEDGFSRPELHVFKDLPDGEDLFDTDPIRLKQVLENLLDNAIRFTEKGIVSFGYEKHDGSVLFFVQDSGVGIPQDELPEIFKRFYKADNQSLLGEPGVGLGLSIARHLVQNMGSEGIEVKSKMGRGSRFWFELPC